MNFIREILQSKGVDEPGVEIKAKTRTVSANLLVSAQGAEHSEEIVLRLLR